MYILHPLWHDEKQLSDFSDLAILEGECPELHNTKCQMSVHKGKRNYMSQIYIVYKKRVNTEKRIHMKLPDCSELTYQINDLIPDT